MMGELRLDVDHDHSQCCEPSEYLDIINHAILAFSLDRKLCAALPLSVCKYHARGAVQREIGVDVNAAPFRPCWHSSRVVRIQPMPPG
jgi:hypothetical protein